MSRLKKLKRLMKRMVFYGASLAFLNYFGLPVCYFLSSSKKQIKDKRIQQVCKVDSHLEDIVANLDVKNCGVLPLVKAAHALTSKYLTYEFTPKEEMKRALEEGIGDCSYFSLFTYSNFLYLADKFGRPELKGKVRLCNGSVPEGFHAWMQVNLDDKWVSYEATFDILNREDNINFKHVDRFYLPNWAVLRRNDDYYLFAHTQLEKDELVKHVDFFASFKYGVDTITLIKELLKDR